MSAIILCQMQNQLLPLPPSPSFIKEWSDNLTDKCIEHAIRNHALFIEPAIVRLGLNGGSDWVFALGISYLSCPCIVGARSLLPLLRQRLSHVPLIANELVSNQHMRLPLSDPPCLYPEFKLLFKKIRQAVGREGCVPFFV